MRLLIITQKVNKDDQNLGFFHEWILNFSKYCESVKVISLERGNYSLPSNVSVYSLGKEQKHSRIQYLFRFYSYIWKLRNEYDVVFVHMNTEYVVLGGIIWKILGKPVYLWRMHKSITLSMRIAVLFIKKAFTASKDSFRLQTSKLVITGHGVDVSRFALDTSEKDYSMLKLITTGRISRVKQYEVLLAGVAQLQKSGIPVSLTVVGGSITDDERNYLDTLKVRVDQLGIKDSVFFVGAVPHEKVVDYLKAANIFVSASSTGSLDKAGLEAFMVGLMVITSNDSFHEIFENYLGQGIYTSGDVGGLVKTIHAFLDLSPHEKQAMLSAIRATIAKKHSLESLIPKLVQEMKL
jgi:glycosyltransferase involved in cell wall biosynthesis